MLLKYLRLSVDGALYVLLEAFNILVNGNSVSELLSKLNE
jgi:hypothetical protein